MTADNRVGNTLQQHGFTGSRWRNNQAPLAKAHWDHHIHDPCGIVLGVGFQTDFTVRIKRREIVKQDFIARDFRIFKINSFYLQQSKIALGFFGLTDLPRNGITGSQVKATNLGW